MKRILFIIGQMDAGGAESFIMKMYRSIDRNKYQFDFVIHRDGFYSNEIRQLGGKIFYTEIKKNNLFKSMKELSKIVEDNHYQYVIRFGTSNASYFDLLAAKRGGAKYLGVRTLSANQGGLFKRMVSLFLRPFLNSIATIKFAPSLKAAHKTYGRRSKNTIILNNGIEFSDYMFSEKNRNSIRQELKIEGDYVVFGHVGRMSKEKNHSFLFKVFAEYHKNYNKKSILICVGNGPLAAKLKKETSREGLEKNIIFLGQRSDVASLYSAFDCFLFPSFYEGMPNALIEAQANGLACFYSNKITKECELSNNIFALKLNAKKWVDYLEKCSFMRMNNYSFFKERHYLIEDTVKLFIEKLTQSKY